MDRAKQLAEVCFEQYRELKKIAINDPNANRMGHLSYEMCENLWIASAILTVGELLRPVFVNGVKVQ